MVVYFDTSALIKKYIDEEGSENLMILMQSVEKVLLSTLTIFEMFSVFSRNLHAKEISKREYIDLKQLFIKELKSFAIIEFSDKLINEAMNLFEVSHLKTLDLLQLSFAIDQRHQIDKVAVSDSRLKQEFEKNGFIIFDPIFDQQA